MVMLMARQLVPSIQCFAIVDTSKILFLSSMHIIFFREVFFTSQAVLSCMRTKAKEALGLYYLFILCNSNSREVPSPAPNALPAIPIPIQKKKGVGGWWW